MTNQADRIQNAINHIKTATDVDPWAMELAVKALEKELKNSTQGVKSVTDINVGNNDTISRQAAIDVIDYLLRHNDDAKRKGHSQVFINGMEDGYFRVRSDILSLPSVQPETIRCKDCKYFEYDHPYVIQGVPVLGHEICNAWGDGCKTNENGYCFLAERRTDG